MAPKQSKKESLGDLASTLSKEELQEAKKFVADLEKNKVELKRKESQMSYYMNNVTGEHDPKNGALRGEARRNFLLLFMAKQIRDKGGEKTMKTVHQAWVG